MYSIARKITNPPNSSQAYDESDDSRKYGPIRIQMTIVDASASEDYSADSKDAADHQDLPPSPPVEAAVPQNQASAEETSTQQTYADEQDLQRQFFDNLKKHTRQFIDIRNDFFE